MYDWIKSSWGVIDIILLVVAIYLFFKIRSLLGQGGRIDGEEQAPASHATATSEGTKDALPAAVPQVLTDDQLWERATKADQLGPNIIKDKQSYLDVMHELRLLDPAFTLDLFLERACDMYETITAAYAKGDLDALKGYLSQSVYATFSTSVQQRKQDEQDLVRALVGFKKVQVDGLYFSPTEIKVATSFLCDVVSVLKDKEGTVISGDPIMVRPVKDNWVFLCDRTVAEPKWIISETA